MADITEIRLTHCRHCRANRYNEHQRCTVCGSTEVHYFLNYKCEECSREYQTDDAAAECCPDAEEDEPEWVEGPTAGMCDDFLGKDHYAARDRDLAPKFTYTMEG